MFPLIQGCIREGGGIHPPPLYIDTFWNYIHSPSTPGEVFAPLNLNTAPINTKLNYSDTYKSNVSDPLDSVLHQYFIWQVVTQFTLTLKWPKVCPDPSKSWLYLISNTKAASIMDTPTKW